VDEYLALRFVAGIASVGGIVTSLENLRHWQELRRWFVQPWQSRARDERLAHRGTRSVVSLTRPRLLWLLYLRLGLFVALLASSLLGQRPSGIVALLLATLLIFDTSVRLIGGDGADQMTVLACIAVACSVILSSPHAATIGLAFLAAQAWLAYVTSGVAKMASDDWMRSGVMGKILDTQTYGHELAARLFRRSPRLDRILSACLGAMEVAIPVLCLAPSQDVLLAGLAIGLSFHAGCAIFMGLNNFVWAFVSTYPAIYYMHWYIYGGRS
jgi:hypothetical protein